MKHDNHVYVKHAIDAAEKAVQITAGLTIKEFLADDILTLAAVRLL